MRNKSEPALNPDLWATLLDLCRIHEIRVRVDRDTLATLTTGAVIALARKPPLGPICRRTWVTTTPGLDQCTARADEKDR